MDFSSLALYPFISQASKYVEDLRIPIGDLFSDHAFERVRIRGKERVLQAIQGEIIKSSPEDRVQAEIELLSYPLARILVSCIKDSYLIRRYALAEAKSAYQKLISEKEELLAEIGLDLGVSSTLVSHIFKIHFTDYIRSSSNMKDPKWKLVNRKLYQGWVFLTKEEFSRLLQENIRVMVQKALPLEVPKEICSGFASYLEEIRSALGERKSEFQIGLPEIQPEEFPPCIAYALTSIRSGVNLAHSARFALTSFLLNIGMGVEDIINLFRVSPDFDEEKTSYQIQHIAGSTGTAYTSPSCATMNTYGNCVGKNDLCRKISHPLNYYRIRARGRKLKLPEEAPGSLPNTPL